MENIIPIFESSIIVIIFIMAYVLLSCISNMEENKITFEFKNNFIKSLNNIWPILYVIYFYIAYLIFKIMLTPNYLSNSQRKIIYLIYNFLILLTFLGIIFSTTNKIQLAVFFFICAIGLNGFLAYNHFKFYSYHHIYLHVINMSILFTNLIYLFVQL